MKLCMDILHAKCRRDGLQIPEDVIRFIAETANGSVRDLEGVINSLLAYSVVYNTNIDMRLAERVIKRAVKVDNKPLTVDDILEKVCHHYGVSQQSVFSRSRKRDFVLVRQVSMYLAQKYIIMEKVESDPQSMEVKGAEMHLWEKIKAKSSKGRRTGVGITAEGDMIAAMGLRYGTQEATDFSVEVHKTLALNAYRSSVEMATERGAFEIYDAQPGEYEYSFLLDGLQVRLCPERADRDGYGCLCLRVLGNTLWLGQQYDHLLPSFCYLARQTDLYG